MVATLSALLLLYILWAGGSSYLAYARRRRLMQKYRNEVIVDRILNHQAWAGQTEEQLLEALGAPQRKFSDYSGQSTIYSYDEIGTGRFRLNVIVRHGVVTGCSQHIYKLSM